MSLEMLDPSLHPVMQMREAILEDLNAAALQYVNVANPKERAARQKRVLQSEIDGLVDEAATLLPLAW